MDRTSQELNDFEIYACPQLDKRLAGGSCLPSLLYNRATDRDNCALSERSRTY